MPTKPEVTALADRIRPHLAATTGVSEKTMFGGIAFLIGGNMAVAAGGQGGLMVRCDPVRTDVHVEAGANRMVMRGRAMDGWLQVGADAVADEKTLARWISVGSEYAATLPSKV